MSDLINTLLTALKSNSVTFAEVIDFIETYYIHQPTSFKNGDIYNEATQNQGSAKIFAFAKINNLSAENTLYLFAEHYSAVVVAPNGTDHQNIRQFIMHGWEGVTLNGEPLIAKA